MQQTEELEKEKNREYCRSWRKKNADKLKKYQKNWRDENKEKAKAYQKKWRSENREAWNRIVRESRQRKKARLAAQEHEQNQEPQKS